MLSLFGSRCRSGICTLRRRATRAHTFQEFSHFHRIEEKHVYICVEAM